MRFFKRRKPKRVLVLGLDCAAPELLFHQFHDDLPVISRLMAGGTWGELTSVIPCITVPAWSCMVSGYDPGQLGIYGFRNRADHSYNELTIADSRAVQVPRLWDHLGDAGYESLVMAVPQTYPLHPLNGHMTSSFLTPGTQSAFAYPAIFKQEILKIAPDYPFDVRPFRTDDKVNLLQRIIDMTAVQYQVLEQVMTSKPWDFLMHVNMGVDRIHHGFWRYHDPQHRLYEAGNRFENAIREYYVMVDSLLGRIIERAGDDVVVMVVSDHGAKRMDGAVCINEWLVEQGWLTLKHPLPATGEIAALAWDQIDWSRTQAWSTGGYYGRIFLNIAGREPTGTIAPGDVDSVRQALAEQLTTIAGPDGQPLQTQVFFPERIYRQVNGVAPDLMVYFGDLHWRTVGSLGYGQSITLENDTGPDDANHAENGVFILYDPHTRGVGQVAAHHLLDVTPTILNQFDLAVPQGLSGQVIG